MELRIDETRWYGALIVGDVFIDEGRAWQKLENGRSYCSALNVEKVIDPHSCVEYVGMGVWPTEERLKEVMPSKE